VESESLWVLIPSVLVSTILFWSLGVRSGRTRVHEAVRRVLASGDADASGGSPDEQRVRAGLRGSWSTVREGEETDMDAALQRVSSFLHESVARPLEEAMGGPSGSMRDGVEEALSAVRDLDFFLEEVPVELSSGDLVRATQNLTQEYSSDAQVSVQVGAPRKPIRVQMNEEGFKDALYLILHNAEFFGGGAPVLVNVQQDGSWGRVRVADRGPGFSAEGLTRAHDPFYSTAPGGLGLGLPQAKRLVDAMGGEIELRNLDGGGAVVSIHLPLA
jgi:signal transduction histidine kinase